ncbi:MAG TPA: AarF/UbiB family protein [Methylocella sp.]|jgi:predicted unusual protein kinase regulating ubiquinone biosynthesis (AarF/ABC1/UbiB family)/nucleotide-binding universal stress UspA family protein
MVGTDRSETADQAVQWAASFAERYGAELIVVQVVISHSPAVTEYGASERTRADAAGDELAMYAKQLGGERGRALVIVDDDPAMAIIRAVEREAIDVLVVGNVGMAGRKEFLLGNIPNRICHNARCNVVIVNTIPAGDRTAREASTVIRSTEPPLSEPRLMARGAQIAAVMSKYGLKELFRRSDQPGAAGRRQQAKRLRAALEELGPIYAKLGQVLSTRPDLLPADYIEELATLQDNVAPMSEEEVVQVTEQELGVPWEDVFDSIDPKPLAAGTIAQVHRATLASGDRVVVKVQRPTAHETIEQDLALLEVFAEKVGKRPALNQVIDMGAVFKHLSTSLRRELDFRQEAENIERMRTVLKDYNRLAVPGVHRELSTSRILVMEEIQGVPIAQAPQGPERTPAARQLLESFYKQVLVDGFFHADPHPGNLMWWKDRIYFLDFGMAGTVGADFREHLILLLMALWHEDAGFLTDVTLMMAGASDRSDLDVSRFQAEIGEVMAKYRTVALAEMQIGPILQDMSEISLRHKVPLPASLALAAKALAQVQLATADLDPDLDPFEVAGKFLMRSTLKSVKTTLDPKTVVYQTQKLKVRAIRAIEAVERLVGARPGQKLEVNFRASTLETTIRRAGRQLALGLTAGAAGLATGLTAMSTRVAGWVPAAFGVIAGLLTVGLLVDLVRRR